MRPDTPAAIAALEESLSVKQIQVLRSAYKIMGAKGLNQFNLQDVADEAGVSKATLLYYFGSKENLILLTMQWVLDRVAMRIWEATAGAKSAKAMILSMIDAIFVSAEANRTFYLVFFDLVGYVARIDKFGAVSETFRNTINGLYSDIIRSGVEEGEFYVDDVDSSSAVVRAIIDGLFTQWVQEKDWQGSYARYRVTCKRAVINYLQCTDTVERKHQMERG